MHRMHINSQRLLSGFAGISRFVIWQQSPGCSTDAFKKTGSAASSREDLFSPCCRHGSWMRHTLKRTLTCKEPICAFHSTGNDLTSKSTHQANATCTGFMTTPSISRVAITKVRTFSLTCLMVFSTNPADAKSYFGGACAIAGTPKRSFSSLITASRNANMAGSLSDLPISSGQPSLFSDSTVSLIAAWSSTPLH